jgi:hypothetical protein
LYYTGKQGYLGKKNHIIALAKCINIMEELTAAEQFEAERTLREAVKEIGDIEPEALGDYLLRHIEADRAINDLKKCITEKKEFYKRKNELMRLEYFAFLLTKKP